MRAGKGVGHCTGIEIGLRCGTATVSEHFRNRHGATPVRSRRPGPMLLTVTCLSLLAVPCYAQKKAPDGAKVLLLTGGQREHHGYRDQALILANLLEDTKRYQVTIVEDGAILETPALAKYDIIIVNADRRDPEFKFTKPQQEALVAAVRNGKGYVSIHGGDNAAPDWSEDFREMLGGVFSHDTQGGKLPDGKVKKGTYTIKIADPQHPITKGLSDFELKDEIYYQLQLQANVKPLVTTEYADGVWPLAWTRDYGKGKVFHSVLGHRDFGLGKDDPIQNPNLGKLILQGVDWVAEGIRKP